ncbi:YHS domain-containing (seleno)protein [Aquimarina macrocephali]|uniref:YHS domain-containing (seleno)protein n=1 Tax=Aquimarina macrocephali TaxID=666563 RepID=UPI000463162A|nr:YHS domain-containing (seleno)protein [Aquimarina macrocephali]
MKKMILTLVIAILGTSLGVAQKVNVNKNNVANNGYDVVNYFTTNTAMRGSIEFSTTYNEATYYFANAEHLKAFKANPSQYLPQFDGYCAFAVAKMNKKVPVDPNTFRVDNGKLYLFYNDYWEGKPFNTIIPWIGNESEMEKLANTNWKSLKNK